MALGTACAYSCSELCSFSARGSHGAWRGVQARSPLSQEVAKTGRAPQPRAAGWPGAWPWETWGGGGAAGPQCPSPAPGPPRSCPISCPAPGTASQRRGLITAENAFPVQEASAGVSSAGPGPSCGAEGNWLPVTGLIVRLRNLGPSPLGFSGEGERFVKRSAGICPAATASPLPRGWVYSKKPMGLAELPGLSTQQWVAAPRRPEQEGRGPRTAERVPGALLGSGKAGAIPAGTGGLGSGHCGQPSHRPGGQLPCSALPRMGGAGGAQLPRGPGSPSPAAPCSARKPRCSRSLPRRCERRRGDGPGWLGAALPRSPAPTRSLARGWESPVLPGALTSGCASAGPGGRPPVRMDIPRIAPAGARAGCAALPGSPGATAPESSTKIVAGTVPCLRPKWVHSLSLCSGAIPKGSLFPVAGVPRAGVRCPTPGAMPMVRGWGCCGGSVGAGGAAKHRVPRHSLLLAAGGSAGGWPPPTGFPHAPQAQVSGQAPRSPPDSRSCRFFPMSGSHPHGRCLCGRQERGAGCPWGLGDTTGKPSPSSSSRTLPRASALGQAGGWRVGVCTGQPPWLGAYDGAASSVP